MIPESVKQAMAGWIAPDTWHTIQPSDLGRFYDFVTVLCDERFMDEALIRQAIHKEIDSRHPNFNLTEKELLVDQFVFIAAQIYHYRVVRKVIGVRGGVGLPLVVSVKRVVVC